MFKFEKELLLLTRKFCVEKKLSSNSVINNNIIDAYSNIIFLSKVMSVSPIN